MNRAPLLVPISLLLVSILASGCVVEDPEAQAARLRKLSTEQVHVLAADKTPIAHAQVTAARGNTALALLRADQDGVFRVKGLPAGTDRLVFGAPGFVTEAFDLTKVPTTVTLKELEDAAAVVKGFLGFRKPVDLLCTGTARCGEFGEPVVEVAGDGTIWASATCCIGFSPPIWISKDGGATFRMLRGEGTGVVRDVTGIEGDFAIDDAGNVYFFDILAGTSMFTSYTSDGKHRHTLAWPYEPLVDRPWVRAGKADQVFVFYNTASKTNFYASADGGKTWDATASESFACPLGTPGQGPVRDRLFVVACSGTPRLWVSNDAGKTWQPPVAVPMPDIKIEARFGRGTEAFMPPVSDERGNIYVPFTHFLDDQTQEKAVFIARYNADKTWSGPWQASPGGQNAMPWPAASRDGQLAIAYYHAGGKRDNISALEWRLHVSASIDASGDAPNFQIVKADPDIVARGALGRQPGDFLEADLTPDGRFVVVYARRVDGPLVNRFISSDGGLDLSPETFLNGPRKP